VGVTTESGTEPSMRRAGDEDVGAIRKLVADAYRHYEPLIGRTPIPMQTDYSVAVHEHDVWILESDAEVIGVLDLAVRDDYLWVENVAIAPDRQGLGLGRRLLDHAEDEARRHGLSELRLLTNERYVRNIAMYVRYGYRETHREPYQGTDLVYFTKSLDAPAGS
jgi:N-acetylglutamate synthase-like GNAT family acetyltransferase